MDHGKAMCLEYPYNTTESSFNYRMSTIKEDIICKTLQKGRAWL